MFMSMGMYGCARKDRRPWRTTGNRFVALAFPLPWNVDLLRSGRMVEMDFLTHLKRSARLSFTIKINVTLAITHFHIRPNRGCLVRQRRSDLVSSSASACLHTKSPLPGFMHRTRKSKWYRPNPCFWRASNQETGLRFTLRLEFVLSCLVQTWTAPRLRYNTTAMRLYDLFLPMLLFNVTKFRL